MKITSFVTEDAHVDEAADLEISHRKIRDRRVEAEARRPTAEEQGDDERGADHHRRVFAHEKHREFHRGILRVVAADEFRFALGKVEGHAVRFRENGDREDQERNEGGYPEQGGLEVGQREFPVRPERQQ